MSDNLIVMPEAPKDLVGRILSLNLQICKKFQCGGFWLNVNRPYAVVEPIPMLQQDMLHRGLQDGRLLDITEQNITGIQRPEGSHSPAKESEEKGKAVYFQIDSKGNVLVVAPKDEAAEEQCEKELRERGTLTVDTYDVADGFLEGANTKIDPNAAGQILDGLANKLDETKNKHYVTKLK
jgi:hypothetical protein